MRFSRASTLFALTTILQCQNVAAALISELLQEFDIFNSLEKRCENPCGYYGQLCCASNEYCYTNSAGQAACGASAGQTVVYTTYIPAPTQNPTLNCAYSQGECACGTTCCKSGYYCQSNNMCVQVPGGSSGYYSNVFTVTTVVTNTAGVPVRPTTQTILTLTSSVTGTTAFQSPVSTGGALVGASSSSGGLSGGAIAGIVIGVLAAIVLLFLICLCCCAKGAIDAVLAIFGLGPRRKRVTEETIIEERHRRTGMARWFGQRPSRTTEVEVEEKKSSGFGRVAGVTAFLGTTAVLLGLKRRHDEKKAGSDVSYSYDSYYSYDYTSDSSPSSVTRTSRRSRSRR